MTIKIEVTTPGNSSFTAVVDDNIKMTEHFALSELANVSAKEDIKMVWNETVQLFLKAMEDLRSTLVDMKYINYLKVNSNYRTASYNASHGGAKNSSHLSALAMDISISRGFVIKVDDEARYIVSAVWKKICQKYGRVGYICWYTNGFHFDFIKDGLFKIYDYRGTTKDW